MANLVTPRFWKKKALLLKSEVTYGTDSAPDGAANWIEARNVTLTPMDNEVVDRNIEQDYMGNGGKVIAASWAKVTFDVALAPSGAAGTAPKWSPLLLACGYAETVSAGVSVAYNLVSAAFGSASIYVNIDGTLHKLTGCRGECKGKLSAKGIPMMSFEVAGVFAVPTAVAMPALTKTGWTLEEAVNSANSAKLVLNGVDLAYSTLEWSTGNQIARIDLPGPQKEVAITDRKPALSVTVLAPALGDFDPFALGQAGTNVALSTTHGSGAGKQAKLDGKVVVTGVDYDRVDDMLAYKLTLDPQPVAGNDELALTCL